MWLNSRDGGWEWKNYIVRKKTFFLKKLANGNFIYKTDALMIHRIEMRGGVTAPFLRLLENFGFLKKMINLVETNLFLSTFVFGAPMMPNVVFCQLWLFLAILLILRVFWFFFRKPLKTPQFIKTPDETYRVGFFLSFLVIFVHFWPFLIIFCHF